MLHQEVKVKIVDICILILVISISYPKCFSQEIQLDHVITVVSDMDNSIKYFTEKGFTVKKGKLHKNGLINGHVKFKNRTFFEIMSIKGEPSDELSKDYQDLLKNGEGGVYIALAGISTSLMERKLTDLKISYITTEDQNWNYITFPKNSGLSHFFFIENHVELSDPIEILTHKNNSEKIKAVWTEGDDYVKYFLSGIGLRSSGEIEEESFGKGMRYSTKTGEIIIVSKNDPDKRSRIKSIVFGTKDPSKSVKVNL